ncbi:Shedu anti-phage system protein SduA domain-containing protein [Acidovorax temperans]|uniref:Shedu anti-phage system protein SduA domain-containing protein n=1 Tax=Acidovorax temperans TaxID=80878 RepID=UPI0030CFCC03
MNDDEFERILQFYKLSEDLKTATNKNLEEIAELAYVKFGVDLDEYDFASQIAELDSEIRDVVVGLKSKYGGEPYDVENLKLEIRGNRELGLHLSNTLRAKNLIDEIRSDFDLDLENLELASKVAKLVSCVVKIRARKDIIPLIHRGLYAEDIKSALEFWSRNAGSDLGKLESTWQQEFSTRKSILERVIEGRISFLQAQAHVGGDSLNGRGDKITDYMFHHSDTRNVSLVEIKTPCTKLLGKSYRGTYALSDELSGTIAQVLTQRVELTKHFFSKVHISEIPFEVNAPKCYIVSGNLGKEFEGDLQKKRAFEMHRQAVVAAVTIITFDELYDQFSKFNVAA